MTEYIERGSKIEALMQHMRKLGAVRSDTGIVGRVASAADGKDV